MNEDFLINIVNSEIAGKNNAIHAYDKMIWTVRTGFLTLVFVAWSFVIKAGIEQRLDPAENPAFVYILSAFSLVLAIGGYKIDLNYARRKFRVIRALNEIMEIICSPETNQLQNTDRKKLTRLLQVSGDAANKDYRQKSFENEIIISKIIYAGPALLIIGILVYYLIII
jgi:hypothetical protein